jgi:AcrR family transcriptional regulator
MQGYEITPRKHPTQRRAQATFDALVEACARLLPELGYERLTTNAIAERAGVGIGSLYEYFPGKDAIIAQVVERLVERVMARLGRELDAVLQAKAQDAVDRWIARVHETLECERALIAVLVQEVPYTRQLPSLRDLTGTLLAFSERARCAAGIEMPRPAASLLLINNLVSSTILQVVLGPPSAVSKDEMIGTLGARVSELIAASSERPAAKPGG